MHSKTRTLNLPLPERQDLRNLVLPLALGVFVFGVAPGVARAQTDLDPPLPNVMLLVDSSGSMEYKLDGSGFPACYPDGSQASEKSRWIDLVEVLTGAIQNYRCQAVDRSSAAFVTDYDMNGSDAGRPADYLYENPYHRPMSGECVAVPGTINPSQPYAFPDTAIAYREYDAPSSSCTFSQTQNGILDAYASQVRFGLMTFDTLTDAATGISGGSMNYEEGMRGGWSYEWGSSPLANPAACLEAPLPFDAGARNAGAPPWEGRMVAFGDPASGSLEFQTKRSQIEKVLLSTRPYGATPIAGILHDARDFFLNDDSDDPLAPSRKFGPRADPYVIDTTVQVPDDDDPDDDGTTRVIRGCREQSLILLTDGRPNLDMRPFCEGGNGGVCPFDKPEAIALELVQRDRPVDTFVIPFALPTFDLGGSTQNCNDLEDTDFDETDPTTPCGNPANQDNQELQACCVLNRIAVAGSRSDKISYYPDARPRAFFSEDREQLAAALSSVLGSTLNVTSRTQPVISGSAAGSTGMRFFSLVQPRPLRPWVGVLRRQRWTCDTDTGLPEPAEVEVNRGDDFGSNLTVTPSARRFVTIRGGNGAEPILSARSMRPYYEPSGAVDGAGLYTAARSVSSPSGFSDAVEPAAMNITGSSCVGLDADACRNRYLRWLVGEDNGTAYSRCPSANDCNLLGDVLHSTPRVVGPPLDLIRDETYLAFAASRQTRPIVLYTSSNDGFLHAFKVGTLDPSASSDAARGLTRANNELWAFIPPAILPDLPMQYPFNHQPLLDGAPVVKDVVATDVSGSDNVEELRFERIQADAIAGANSDARWRTVLVQGFGPMRGGYFALDVTDPELDAGNLSDNARGPRFLWQLTSDAAGNAIFGRQGATPVITTLFFDPAGGDQAREIAVAVLPGGSAEIGTLGDGDGCPEPSGTNFSGLQFSHLVQPRSRVRCYSGADLHARSLSIVRLDNGEIIRSFRRSANELLNTDLQDRVTEQAIDSPIGGQPVAFPAGTGAVADRVYVGDQDGRLWRADLSATDPADWRLELFFDAFPASVDGETLHDFDDGQPIIHPPAVSVDSNGDVTLNFATGNQETLGSAPGTTNYVWSITEKLGGDRLSFTRHVNWYKAFEDGERVVGPLSLFNSQVFFTTYTPADSSAPACKSGESRVWGMDYLRPLGFFEQDPTNLPIDQGGDPRLPDPVAPDDPERYVQVMTAAQATGDVDAVIFGVSIAQQPTCSDPATLDAAEFLGYGEQHIVRNVNPGRFELVMHKGGTAPINPSGSIEQNTATLPLKPPPTASRVESWAALIE